MPCNLSEDTLKQVVAFHGHTCPGLYIGIRASELALQELGHNDEADLVAVVETDMCGVDAIQFLTGCTYGKGNLIHRDYGKMAFSFFSRKNNTGFRALLNQEVRGGLDDEIGRIMGRTLAGTATEEDKKRNQELRTLLQQRIMDADLNDMFHVDRQPGLAPSRARILESLVCEACGETTMESRTRRMGGKTLCIPCFNKVEQKI